MLSPKEALTGTDYHEQEEERAAAAKTNISRLPDCHFFNLCAMPHCQKCHPQVFTFMSETNKFNASSTPYSCFLFFY